ncbi:hypothetical protein GC093_20825 [Paenibacillus sp. LMG 31456]|uniref:Uncharacterized protein n=1 Tax=Paenibacillus foliorum TaxID=2654974 RepID=A0A972GSR5_9BACL|nr:hypothetical protein [Paenibacillus foliorum]NOU95653.1 hypothetical protein [Paenibacillus foliorum]
MLKPMTSFSITVSTIALIAIVTAVVFFIRKANEKSEAAAKKEYFETMEEMLHDNKNTPFKLGAMNGRIRGWIEKSRVTHLNVVDLKTLKPIHTFYSLQQLLDSFECDPSEVDELKDQEEILTDLRCFLEEELDEDARISYKEYTPPPRQINKNQMSMSYEPMEPNTSRDKFAHKDRKPLTKRVDYDQFVKTSKDSANMNKSVNQSKMKSNEKEKAKDSLLLLSLSEKYTAIGNINYSRSTMTGTQLAKAINDDFQVINSGDSAIWRAKIGYLYQEMESYFGKAEVSEVASLTNSDRTQTFNLQLFGNNSEMAEKGILDQSTTSLFEFNNIFDRLECVVRYLYEEDDIVVPMYFFYSNHKDQEPILIAPLHFGESIDLKAQSFYKKSLHVYDQLKKEGTSNS